MWTFCLWHAGRSERGGGRTTSSHLLPFGERQSDFFAVTELLNSVTERHQYYVHHHIPIRGRQATKIRAGSEPRRPGTGMPRVRRHVLIQSSQPSRGTSIHLYLSVCIFLLQILTTTILQKKRFSYFLSPVALTHWLRH